MTKIVEKPDTPISKRANIGLYYIQQLEAAVRGDRPRPQAAEEQGRVLSHRRVPVHDRQGREDPRHRRRGLVRRRARSTRCSRRTASCSRRGTRAGRRSIGDSTIIDPVYIEDDVVLKGARIGPNVSIGRGSIIEQVGAQGHARRIEHEDRRLDARELAHRRFGGHRGRARRADAERPLRGAVALVGPRIGVRRRGQSPHSDPGLMTPVLRKTSYWEDAARVAEFGHFQSEPRCHQHDYRCDRSRAHGLATVAEAALSSTTSTRVSIRRSSTRSSPCDPLGRRARTRFSRPATPRSSRSA